MTGFNFFQFGSDNLNFTSDPIDQPDNGIPGVTSYGVHYYNGGPGFTACGRIVGSFNARRHTPRRALVTCPFCGKV